MKARFGIIEVPRSIASAVENAKLAEKSGFDWFGVADSQSLFRELFVTLAMVGQATERMMIGPSVTNPLTRHPAVMASAAASVQELSGGRAMLGIGTGDSALYNLNERPPWRACANISLPCGKCCRAGPPSSPGVASIPNGWRNRRTIRYRSISRPRARKPWSLPAKSPTA